MARRAMIDCHGAHMARKRDSPLRVGANEAETILTGDLSNPEAWPPPLLRPLSYPHHPQARMWWQPQCPSKNAGQSVEHRSA